MTGREQSAGSRIAVIGKSVRVLDAILDFPGGATPTEIAAATGTNRSTAFRLLTSLEQEGLLQRDAAAGRYRLGLKLLRYGEAVRSGLGIVSVAEPVMRDLRERTRQTVYLSVREGWGARCVHRLTGPDVDVLTWNPGQWLPFHLGAGSQALLAALPDEEVGRYLASGRTPAPEQTRAAVGQARHRGWSFNDEGLTPGVAALGVAVLDRRGAPACALSVAGLLSHYLGDELTRTVAEVRAAARRLAGEITGEITGGTGDGRG
ncbi:MAG TPA: IclR family transcriptional regulator [Trebonia sp.]|jgi:DNA-binding IclR family transcriptional regulator